ncbi:hypothetical protein H7U19_14965 [Hyunsoonleella sp. SJ7]|uniref:Tetratricopeptide repeat protein n=1 Tax=Hyunsoonleella aquatilis TaxID=2762758 RepID=A0A923KLQ5_9FLAO|nr:tetratricopeptide repeat protein [Hyunsoonleella aquatilis]MBC3759712.1 hypothetical protein [Hyunsoonleella aquatilis]
MKIMFRYSIIAFFFIAICSCKDKEKSNVLIINPEKAKEYFESGISKMSYNDNRGALLDFKRALEYNPEYYEACLRAAKCNQSLGNDVDAGRYYSTAISIRPDSGEAYYLRGVNLLSNPEGKDSACYDFSKAAELNYPKAKYAIIMHCN